MKLSDYIVEFLENKSIDNVFGYIGGSITHMVDSISKSKKINFIQVYHEQTAAIAAEGYSRNSNKIGVAMATSGPGATNLITGIADAYFDSIPTVYITGQVNTYEYKYDKPIRQQGFQETDVVNIVKPITKYAVLVDDANEIRYHLEKAFEIAQSGRPGPVLLDIPMNIQRTDINPNKINKYDKKITVKEKSLDIKKIKEMIGNSERPLILSGGGIIKAKAENLLNEFAEKNNLPVVTSLMGKGAFNEESELFVGMIGSYGNRCANMAISNADLLIALGSRLDTRQTGALLEGFLREGKIIHVDIDQDELDFNRLPRREKISLDVKKFLNEIININFRVNSREKWYNYLDKLKLNYNQEKEIKKNVVNKFPYKIMDVVNYYSRKKDIFCIDVGQNQMFAAQKIKIKNGQKFFTSGGLAPMGYALPAAIGASFATPQRRIIAITGDGGFQISTQSLMLISQYNLPIKVLVLNNKSLGLITQFQDLYFDKRKVGTMKKSGYHVPGIKDIAKAYNLDYYKVNKNDIENREYLDEIFKNDKNCIIEFLIEGLTKVFPKLEYDSPIEDPTPKLKRIELEENMWIKPYNQLDK